jgi:hypothetical protein
LAKGKKVVGNDARINDGDTSGNAVITSVMEMEIRGRINDGEKGELTISTAAHGGRHRALWM